MVVSHCQTIERSIMLTCLDGMGKRLDERHEPGAKVFLYDLSKPPERTAR